MQEAETYGDLVIADFKDTYENMTLKVGLALKWIVQFCPTAETVMRHDDDAVVLSKGLGLTFNAHKEWKLRNHIWGHSSVSREPNRDKTKKW